MFGYDVLTTVAALVALSALLAAVPLLLSKSFAALAGAIFIGAAAWNVGGLSAATFAGVSAAAVAAFVLLLDAVLDALGVQLPVSVGVIVLVVVALALLSKSRGKKK